MARAPPLQQIEELPEADRLGGVPHPRFLSHLYGHHAAERTLAEALHSHRLHHAWLIAGPQGIGKAALAYRFAAAALSDPSDRDAFGQSLGLSEETSASRQVRALAHPGLLVIRRPWDQARKRHKTEIPIDEVRRLKGFLNLTVEPGAWRVVIVDSADELNAASANALLKSLEEPPRQTVFLLVSSEPGRLLPTVRSRCRLLRLGPLGSDELRKAAMQALDAADLDQPEAAQWSMLIDLSGGSVRRLLSLHAAGGIELSSRIDAILSALPRVDWRAAHALSDELAAAAAEQRFELFYSILQDRISRLVRVGFGAGPESSEAASSSRPHPPQYLASLAELWETVAREKTTTLALNLDRKALILETLARLEGLAGAGRS